MTLATLCIGLFALLIGLAICFSGYRWFLILLPIFGFFVGFFVGAQGLQALLGDTAFLTVTSWVVGFILGLITAVLSYLFYFIAVALIGGAIGYGLVVGILQAIGLDMSLIVWLLGVVGGVIAAIITIVLNLQKWVIILFTSLAGAAIIIGSFFLAFGQITVEEFSKNAVQAIISESWLWLLAFIVLAVLGFLGQMRMSSSWAWEEPEDRWPYDQSAQETSY